MKKSSSATSFSVDFLLCLNVLFWWKGVSPGTSSRCLLFLQNNFSTTCWPNTTQHHQQSPWVVHPLHLPLLLLKQEKTMHIWHSQDLLLFLSLELSPTFLSCNGTQHHQPSQWITSYKNESNFSNHSGWRMSRRARWLGCLPWWWGQWRSRWRGWARAWCSPWRCGAPSRLSHVGAYTMLNLLSSDFWTFPVVIHVLSGTRMLSSWPTKTKTLLECTRKIIYKNSSSKKQ